MKVLRNLLFLLGVIAFAGRAEAGILYAATSAGGPGELYIINQSTGAIVQDIGPLNDASGLNYPITGLAFGPGGNLYGSSGNSVTASEAKLVKINPATAQVTLIGSFNAGPVNGTGVPTTMADIDFDANGNLYGVASIGGPHLYSINTSTGQATVIGTTGLTSTSGGGLAIGGGSFFGSPTSSRFGTYNTGTGAFTNIVNPTKPVGGGYAALGFDGAVLYGLDLGPGSAGDPTHLVTFNTTTGAVTDIAPSVNKLDAIAFRVPEPATFTFGLFVLGALMNIRRRSR
jgi:hypothetical protein